MFFINQDGLNASAATVNLASVGGKDGYLRPACGVININYPNFKDFKTFNSLQLKEARRTFFHEISHALVFTPQLIPHFIDDDGNKVKPSDVITLVNTPKLKNHPFLSHVKIKKLVSEYFKCQENVGMPLVAKDKAHFVQQIISDTMMRPMADSFQDRVTSFIKQLYLISGWYLLSEDIKVEETLWGKGKGCRFVQMECTDDKGKIFEEYCDESNAKLKQGCDYYYRSPAFCTLYKALEDNTCPYMYPSDTDCAIAGTETKALASFPDQVFGKNSKCVEYEDTQNTRFAGCFEASCDDSSKTIKIKIGKTEEFAKYDTGKPSKDSFMAQVGNLGKIKFNFPENYDRFCFYQSHPQKEDKGFKKRRFKKKRSASISKK